MDRVIVIEGDPMLLLAMDGESSLLMPFDGDPDVIISGTTETHETYEGSYEVTPTRQEQVLLTANKILLENIVVNPIPQNYGLITWNGAVMTVS